MAECKEYAKERVQSALKNERARVATEDKERLAYLENLSGAATSGAVEERTLACASADAALDALNAIVNNHHERSQQPDYDSHKDYVIMKSVDNVPKYDAWVPVRTNFWVGKDMELEPYMPYFGDDNEGRSKASICTRIWRKTQSKKANSAMAKSTRRGSSWSPIARRGGSSMNRCHRSDIVPDVAKR